MLDAKHEGSCTLAPPYQDKTLRNLPCKRVQMDEIWSFVYAENDNVEKAKAAPATAGEVWDLVATARQSALAQNGRIVTGEPDHKHISTSYAERSNL